MVCFGAPCCVVPCFAVLRRAGLCCIAVRSAPSCCAALCRAVVCLAVTWLAALCCAVPRRVVLCSVVVHCTAVRSGAVCRAASCCAVFCCAVVCGGPFSLPLRRGFGSALVRLARFLVRDAGRGYAAGWWTGGAVRCGVARWIRVVGVRLGRSARWVWWLSAGCPCSGPVPWSCVFSGSLPLELCQALWGGVSWPPRVCWVPSGPVPLPPCCLPSWVSRPCPVPPLVPVPLLVCWPFVVAGVIAWG